MFYGARFFDQSLGRFLSADTIVPGAGNPQAWDRYAYVLNNPLSYTDPSGHNICNGPLGAKECADAGMNAEDYDYLVKNGTFAPTLINGEANDTTRAYDRLRKDLYTMYGYRYVDRSGKISDQAFIAAIMYVEFDGIQGTITYKEAKEALSNQYYSTEGSLETPCFGSCTLEEQLIWAQGMHGLRTSKLDTTAANFDRFMNDSYDVMQEYHHGTDDSWAWGNVYKGSDLYELINSDPSGEHETDYVAGVEVSTTSYFMVFTADQSNALTEDAKGW